MRDTILGNPGTDFLWGGGALADAWPASPDDAEYSRVRTSLVETLLVGGTLDFATPPQVATNEILSSLPNGHQVVLTAFGHAMSFWNEQPQAGARLITTFLTSGQVDDSLYTPARVNFTPALTQTKIAKIIVGTLVGCALLAILSLLWKARQVQKRGRFGRKASATLRSLSPILLGPGGWFLGALIVLATLPGIPLDDALLATLSVGVPIAFGVYLAWVSRDWSARIRAAGFGAVIGGALVGAWLGYHATDGFFALITTIVGAAAGTNLALLLLDIAWDWQTRDRVAVTTVNESLEVARL